MIDLSPTRNAPANDVPPDPVAVFVGNLNGLTKSERKTLAGCLGRSLARALEGGASPRVLRLFFTLLPSWTPRGPGRKTVRLAASQQFPAYFIVATLYGVVGSRGQGNLGQSARTAPVASKRRRHLDAAMLNLRGAALPTLPTRLATIVRLCPKMQIDFYPLTVDLLRWRESGAPVTRRWLNDYLLK